MADRDGWVSSSFCSDTACIQVKWVKSSASLSNGTCVEVSKDVSDGMILVRNSKHPEVPPLRFDRAEWEAFTKGVESGEFRFLDEQ